MYIITIIVLEKRYLHYFMHNTFVILFRYRESRFFPHKTNK